MMQRYIAGFPECHFHLLETATLYQMITKDQVHNSENAANQPLERRKSKRVDVNKKAIINLAGLSVCNCIVKDVSNTGARILVSNQSWVPKQFLIDGLLPDERILVSQVWHEGEQIGVEFLNVTWLSEWIDEQHTEPHMQTNRNSVFG